MHIGTRQSDVAQAFRAEFPLVLGIACHCPQPVITGRIGPLAVLVIQAGIVKACFWKGHVSRADIVGQIQPLWQCEHSSFSPKKSASPRCAAGDSAVLSPCSEWS